MEKLVVKEAVKDLLELTLCPICSIIFQDIVHKLVFQPAICQKNTSKNQLPHQHPAICLWNIKPKWLLRLLVTCQKSTRTNQLMYQKSAICQPNTNINKLIFRQPVTCQPNISIKNLQLYLPLKIPNLLKIRITL
jgi:hypothetical protein